MDIYCIAIGGTGMAPLACLMQARGHRVRGSDGPLYPPMSTLLAEAGIEPEVGWDPAHLEPPPDLVVVGNAVPRTNPEAEAVERSGIERLSMPEALWRFFLSERRRLVVAGTHGKTTTTSMAAWVWSACGRDPSYLVGGVPADLPASFHLGDGDLFVLEGDEYNAAYFDRGPKFLHYRPDVLILTSGEYDHADLYPSHEALLAVYGKLVAGIPEDGLLVACGDDPDVVGLLGQARCRVVTYGLGEGCAVRAMREETTVTDEAVTDEAVTDEAVTVARITGPGVAAADEGTLLRLRVPGDHNLSNALAVWVAARAEGLPAAAVTEALARFSGVARRLEEIGRVPVAGDAAAGRAAGDVIVIDDFAHHPTAVAASLDALRRRHPERRLVALFEPRSLTAGRAFLEDAYLDAFAGADRVLLAPVFHAGRLDDDERLDLDELAAQLRHRGVEAMVAASVDALERRALADARPGDVLVTMSSGSFEGLPRRLVDGLERARVASS